MRLGIIRGWRWLGLGVELGAFRDQGVEVGVGLGVELGAFRDQGVEVVGLGVELGAFRDQGVEGGRFRG